MLQVKSLRLMVQSLNASPCDYQNPKGIPAQRHGSNGHLSVPERSTVLCDCSVSTLPDDVRKP
jgi:hypothetical protein